MMAAHARLAGLDVGTRSVTCSLGLRPVAQPAPFTSTVERGPRTMNTDKTTIRTAKLRTVRSRRMNVKWSNQAYIAYAGANSECVLPLSTITEPTTIFLIANLSFWECEAK